jgi:hypothetical protein
MRRRQILSQKTKPAARAPETPQEAYERKFGKPPHHRMKLETILERLKDE